MDGFLRRAFARTSLPFRIRMALRGKAERAGDVAPSAALPVAVAPPARPRHPAPQERDAAPEPGPPRTCRVAGQLVSVNAVADAVSRIVAWAARPPARVVLPANLERIAAARTDPLLRRALSEADLLLLCDHALAMLARADGTRGARRIGSAALLDPLARMAAQKGLSVFLVGQTLERLHRTARRLKARHPSLDVRGIFAPPPGFERDPATHAELLVLLRTVRPHLVLVALGSPLEEVWANAMADAVPRGVFLVVDSAGLRTWDEAEDLPGRTPPLGAETVRRLASAPLRLRPRHVLLAARLPALYTMHRRDREEFDALQRRQALAALSDERYRVLRQGVRGGEEAAIAAAAGGAIR